ncbi:MULTISPECIES: hypothetical protein [Erysipelotrichaceae]|jgi:hypothetical protein|uniref:hypothetical protein n=1 Tax=Erysipelotrichaceae TaxID=128827 RepID=UPI0025B04E55|nr:MULTISPECIES: hypothetical protein [Erysipelotrichaceae]
MNRRLMMMRNENELLIMNAAAHMYETGELKEEHRKELDEKKEMCELGACLLRICQRSEGNTDPVLNIPVDKGGAYLWQKVLASYKKQDKQLEELREDFSFVYSLMYLTEAESDCTALNA